MRVSGGAHRRSSILTPSPRPLVYLTPSCTSAGSTALARAVHRICTTAPPSKPPPEPLSTSELDTVSALLLHSPPRSSPRLLGMPPPPFPCRPPDPLPGRGALHCGAARRLDLLVLALMVHRSAQEAVGEMGEHNRIEAAAEWKMFCGMKPSFDGLHMGSIRISWWVGLIRLVCTQGARVVPNRQIWRVCTVTVESEPRLNIYIYRLGFPTYTTQ
jgi:hypothetical protein